MHGSTTASNCRQDSEAFFIAFNTQARICHLCQRQFVLRMVVNASDLFPLVHNPLLLSRNPMGPLESVYPLPTHIEYSQSAFT